MTVAAIEACLAALACVWAGLGLVVWAAHASRGVEPREDRRWFRDYLEDETDRLTLERRACTRARLRGELAAWIERGGPVWTPDPARSH